ncbi:MAG: HNH endonuclease [Ekhidna sp.]|nr:HNH endonuclease [Ekhidna sp.]
MTNYYRVILYVGGKPKTMFIHRLVALAFVATKDKTLTVDHDDNDKYNNCSCNLKWLTRGANAAKANSVSCTLLSPEGKAIEVSNPNAFAKEVGISKSSMQRLTSGAITKHKGWRLIS